MNTINKHFTSTFVKMAMSAIRSLDITATVFIVVSALSAVITTSLAQQMYNDITKYKDYEGDNGDKYSKRAKHENNFLTVVYMFSLIFLIVYVGYIGYKQGMHKASGGAAVKSGDKSLKDYGISMIVFSYIIMVLLVLSGSIGIDMYKTGVVFGTDVSEDKNGDKYKQAQALYGVYIAMIVIAVISFILVTAYLADAKTHMVKFYESWSEGGSSSSAAPADTWPAGLEKWGGEGSSGVAM